MTLICGDCGRELQSGDRYIEGTPDAYLGEEIDPTISGLMADIFSGNGALDGSAGGVIIYCEDCTVTDPAGRFQLITYDGDS